ncbi:DUF4178 domain-containing protein [Roseovarius bejariae]|nr:DUF4178 domain-containing protein [Roseovarius bejariae]
MTRLDGPSAINCPSCGAGLDILGGGRVVVQICSYCGTELDALNDYRALRKFTEMERPETPFSIGMQGIIDGVEYTIIGTLGMMERWRGMTWRWVDHQLYSPTHGYAWLTFENDHLIFTRRFRRPLNPSWMSTRWVETAEAPPVVFDGRERYKYYETVTSEITFAEGEFTWVPNIGDKATTVTAMSHKHMLGFSDTGREREVERSKYLPQDETFTSFGVVPEYMPGKVHPLQPYKAGKNDAFLRNSALVFCVLALVGMIFVKGTERRHVVLPPRTFQITELPQEVSFEITDTEKLSALSFQTDVDNSWAWLEVALYGPDGAPLFDAGREVGYYHGRDADGRWTEGSRRTTLLFRAEEAGQHTAEISVPEKGTWYGSAQEISRLSVSADQGRSSILWLGLCALLFGLFFVWRGAKPALHKRARWRGSDWTDED